MFTCISTEFLQNKPIPKLVAGFGADVAAKWLAGIVAFRRYYRIGLEPVGEEISIPSRFIHDDVYRTISKAGLLCLH